MKREMGLLGLGCVLPALGCNVHMAAPSDVAQASEVLLVADRSRVSGALANESFKMGSFEVTDVNRDWNSGTALTTGPYSREEANGGYAFKFKAGGKVLLAGCASKSANNAVGLGGGMSLNFGYEGLRCTCGTDAEVSVKASLNRSYKGTMKLGSAEHAVTSVHELEGGASTGDPAGYRVDGGGALGAVDVLYPGKVWLKKGMAEADRAAMSCLFAGLMLYQPPRR